MVSSSRSGSRARAQRDARRPPRRAGNDRADRRPGRARLRAWAGLLAGVVLGLATAQPAAGGPRASTGEFDPLNHAFAVYLGGGLYASGDRTMFVIRAVPKITLRDEIEHPFGIRLRFTGTVGLLDAELDELPSLGELPDLVGTFAFLPGVEFPIRIYDNWTLIPFVDVGVASDTAFHDTTIVTGIGTGSRAEFHDGRHAYVLWNQLVAAANHPTGTGEFGEPDGFLKLLVDFEMRGLVDYRLFGRESDLGLLLVSDTYFNGPVLGPPGEKMEIRQRWEVGFTTGATERWKTFWNKITVPRLGVSYRFGQNTAGIRVLLRWSN